MDGFLWWMLLGVRTFLPLYWWSYSLRLEGLIGWYPNSGYGATEIRFESVRCLIFRAVQKCLGACWSNKDFNYRFSLTQITTQSWFLARENQHIWYGKKQNWFTPENNKWVSLWSTTCDVLKPQTVTLPFLIGRTRGHAPDHGGTIEKSSDQDLV